MIAKIKKILKTKKIVKVKKKKKVVKPIKKFLVKRRKIKSIRVKKNSIPKKAKKKVVKKIKKKSLTLKKRLKAVKKKVKRFKKAVKAKKLKVVIKKKKRTRSVIKPEKSTFEAEAFFKAKIKVIGVGGGGGSIVSEIGRSLHKATFVIADTDVRAFRKRPGIKNFLFGQDLTHGLGTGLNPDLAKEAAELEKDKIAKLFDGQDIIIFVAALGGGVGSGATQIFAEAAKDFGGISFGIFTLPFKFEGKNKYKIASQSLKKLRQSLNVSITIPNERIFKIIDPNAAITDAFSMVNRNLIESLESLIDLIYSPGVINIDFADVRAILKGKGNLAFLNTAEASGNDRADRIINDILMNPLYQSNNFAVEKVLFNIEGGNNLSMFEVDKISRVIGEQHAKAKIIFGISKNPQFKNKIKVTLLMTGPGAAEALVEPKVAPEPAKQSKKVVKTIKKSSKKPKKPKKTSKKSEKKKKKDKKETAKKIPVVDELVPVFAPAPTEEMAEAGFKKVSITEPNIAELNDILEDMEPVKKTMRRSALEIKQAEEEEKAKQTQQEKEWEIPAFLRKVKFK